MEHITCLFVYFFDNTFDWSCSTGIPPTTTIPFDSTTISITELFITFDTVRWNFAVTILPPLCSGRYVHSVRYHYGLPSTYHFIPTTFVPPWNLPLPCMFALHCSDYYLRHIFCGYYAILLFPFYDYSVVLPEPTYDLLPILYRATDTPFWFSVDTYSITGTILPSFTPRPLFYRPTTIYAAILPLQIHFRSTYHFVGWFITDTIRFVRSISPPPLPFHVPFYRHSTPIFSLLIPTDSIRDRCVHVVHLLTILHHCIHDYRLSLPFRFAITLTFCLFRYHRWNYTIVHWYVLIIRHSLRFSVLFYRPFVDFVYVGILLCCRYHTVRLLFHFSFSACLFGLFLTRHCLVTDCSALTSLFYLISFPWLSTVLPLRLFTCQLLFYTWPFYNFIVDTTMRSVPTFISTFFDRSFSCSVPDWELPTTTYHLGGISLYLPYGLLWCSHEPHSGILRCHSYRTDLITIWLRSWYITTPSTVHSLYGLTLCSSRWYTILTTCEHSPPTILPFVLHLPCAVPFHYHFSTFIPHSIDTIPIHSWWPNRSSKWFEPQHSFYHSISIRYLLGVPALPFHSTDLGIPHCYTIPLLPTVLNIRTGWVRFYDPHHWIGIYHYHYLIFIRLTIRPFWWPVVSFWPPPTCHLPDSLTLTRYTVGHSTIPRMTIRIHSLPICSTFVPLPLCSFLPFHIPTLFMEFLPWWISGVPTVSQMGMGRRSLFLFHFDHYKLQMEPLFHCHSDWCVRWPFFLMMVVFSQSILFYGGLYIPSTFTTFPSLFPPHSIHSRFPFYSIRFHSYSVHLHTCSFWYHILCSTGDYILLHLGFRDTPISLSPHTLPRSGILWWGSSFCGRFWPLPFSTTIRYHLFHSPWYIHLPTPFIPTIPCLKITCSVLFYILCSFDSFHCSTVHSIPFHSIGCDCLPFYSTWYIHDSVHFILPFTFYHSVHYDWLNFPTTILFWWFSCSTISFTYTLITIHCSFYISSLPTYRDSIPLPVAIATGFLLRYRYTITNWFLSQYIYAACNTYILPNTYRIRWLPTVPLPLLPLPLRPRAFLFYYYVHLLPHHHHYLTTMDVQFYKLFYYCSI